MAHESPERTLRNGKRVGEWTVCDRIAKGGFGEIYEARQTDGKRLAAMKIEYRDSRKKALREEIYIMKELEKSPYIPQLYGSGKTHEFRFMCMEMLGPSVSVVRKLLPHRRFNVETGLMLAIESLKCIKVIHSSGFVHADIKPSNFVIRPCWEYPICIIDFGLSRSFIDRDTKRHIKYATDVGFTGTCRYASTHVHNLDEISRRDDLISWFYSIVEIMTGKLPWPGGADKDGTKIAKNMISATAICEFLPREFIGIYEYLTLLEFDEEPNYNDLVSKLELVLTRFKRKKDKPDWLTISDSELREFPVSLKKMMPFKEWSKIVLDGYVEDQEGCTGCNVF